MSKETHNSFRLVLTLVAMASGLAMALFPTKARVQQDIASVSHRLSERMDQRLLALDRRLDDLEVRLARLQAVLDGQQKNTQKHRRNTP